MASTQFDDQPKADPETDPGYTAVLYVHGMGSQRRFEEVSRLIDAIDTYLTNAYRKRGEKLGYLAKIKPRLEPCRASNGDDVTYIRTLHANPAKREMWESPETRFYEIYWAPLCPSSDNLEQQRRFPFGGSGSSLIEIMRFQFRGASAA